MYKLVLWLMLEDGRGSECVRREIPTHFEIFQWKPSVLAHKHSQ